MAERYRAEMDPQKPGRKGHNMGVRSFLVNRWKFAASQAVSEGEPGASPSWNSLEKLAPMPTTLAPGQRQGSTKDIPDKDIPDIPDIPSRNVPDIPDKEDSDVPDHLGGVPDVPDVPDLSISGEARLLKALDGLRLEADACENHCRMSKSIRDRTAAVVSVSFVFNYCWCINSSASKALSQ